MGGLPFNQAANIAAFFLPKFTLFRSLTIDSDMLLFR